MNKRFLPWIALFLFLLSSIPFLIWKGNAPAAKFTGVATIVGISVALLVWRRQTLSLKDKKTKVEVNLNDRFWLERSVPFYRKLKKNDRRVFEDRIGLFLAEITITQVDREVPEKDTCFYVAASAVIAYWGLPFWNYGKLSEVLVYPDNYTSDKIISDAGYIQGQVFHGGLMNNTMILSLSSLLQGFQAENDGNNVGVHEFSHLVDKADGSIDGFPVDMTVENRKIWAKVVQEEMKDIQKGKSDINPYAVTNKAEFFAVLNEYYREKPIELMERHPEIFDVLDNYYKQN